MEDMHIRPGLDPAGSRPGTGTGASGPGSAISSVDVFAAHTGNYSSAVAES